MPMTGMRAMAANIMPQHLATLARADAFNDDTDAVRRRLLSSFLLCTFFGFRNSAVFGFASWCVAFCGTKNLCS